MNLWSALLFGLVGSFHCVGMCGAIALSIPMDLSTRLALMRDALFYNLGRVLSYTLLGALLGVFGSAFFASGYQQWLSIELGVLILVLYFLPKALGDRASRWVGIHFLNQQIKKGFGLLLKKPSAGSHVLIGMLNGLLPCGFVYMAAAAALLMGSVEKSAAYMALFGLGTVPMMFTTAISRQFVTMKLRNRIKILKPYLAVSVALLFILRGLALGIPYLSPKLMPPQGPATEAVYCHEP